jgi:RND family efflux transporter MFP subunit
MSPEKSSLDELRIDRRPPPPPRRRSWLVIVIGLLLIAGVAGWWWQRPRALVVRTTTAQPVAAGSARTLLNGSGYVTARRIATVSSKVSGKVVEVLVEEGRRVEANQVLARLDASNAEKSLALSEAQWASAQRALAETKANLEQAQRTHQRTIKLAAEQIATQADLDRAEAEAKALEARLAKQTADIDVAAREVDVWKQQVDDTIIRAPFAGIVTSKNAQPGEMISPMSAGGFTRTGICTIVDMSSLEIEVDVNESYINRVEPGQPVVATLDSYPDWRIPTKVIAIIPTADRGKATVKVRVGFEKLDPRILPDMGVKVAVQSAERAEGSAASAETAPRGVTIPKAAVRQRDGRDIVWVVRDGRIARRAVTVGSVLDDTALIAGGLDAGDRVVVDGPTDITENSKVTEKSP